jgi:selenocysteine lyase/cysteine desulfurase
MGRDVLTRRDRRRRTTTDAMATTVKTTTRRRWMRAFVACVVGALVFVSGVTHGTWSVGRSVGRSVVARA